MKEQFRKEKVQNGTSEKYNPAVDSTAGPEAATSIHNTIVT